jgi:ubiquinone/menaquinone biosynthesis C-methylase UbiE
MNKVEIKERTRKAYNKVGPDYDNWYWMKKSKELRAGLTERVIETLKKELKTQNRKPKILDLCCGTGHLYPKLSKLGNCTGADFSTSMIETCKKRFPEGEFVLADAENLPFKDNSFDAVVCFWSFHHIVYPEF